MRTHRARAFRDIHTTNNQTLHEKCMEQYEEGRSHDEVSIIIFLSPPLPRMFAFLSRLMPNFVQACATNKLTVCLAESLMGIDHLECVEVSNGWLGASKVHGAAVLKRKKDISLHRQNSWSLYQSIHV
jgi:hypothetical protein